MWYRLCQKLPGNVGSGFISVAVMKNWQRQHSRRRNLFALVVQVTVLHRRKSGQGLSQELGAGLLAAPHDSAFNHGTHSKNSTVETTQECCLGAHGPAYTQLGSFYRQDHLPSDGTAHMRWSPPIIQQSGSPLHRHAQDQHDLANSSLETLHSDAKSIVLTRTTLSRRTWLRYGEKKRHQKNYILHFYIRYSFKFIKK